jgi:hypothetical protein
VSLAVRSGAIFPSLTNNVTGVTVLATPDEVIHEKSIATPSKGIIHTASFAPQGSFRLEFAARVSGEIGGLYFELDSQAVSGGPAGQRSALLGELASQGVSIDGPEVGVAYAART